MESKDSRARYTLAKIWSPFYVGGLWFAHVFLKILFYIRLRFCYCYSALCLTLIQTWGTLVVTGKDDNISGFSEGCVVFTDWRKRTRRTHLRPDRYCVSSIDTDESRKTGKYDSYIGIQMLYCVYFVMP